MNSNISQTIRQLPANLPAPPSYQKVNPALAPILFLSMNSPTLTTSAVDDYAENVVAPRISMLSGVAQVNVYGAQKYAVRVQLNPLELARRQIALDQIAGAVEAANVNLPTGTLIGPQKSFVITATGQLNNAAAFRPVIVAYQNGNPVRLQELGNVIDSVQNDQIAAWFVNTRSIVLAIQRQPGVNTVAVVDSILKVLPSLRRQIPATVSLDIMYDRSQSIRSSISEVEFTLLLAVVLVILVIFAFLRNVTATDHPEPRPADGDHRDVRRHVRPGVQHQQPFPHGADPRGGIRRGRRHRHAGERLPPHGGREHAVEAARAGSKEISFTILSMTISLVAVFIPVIFMGGILGRLLHEFAVTIGVAILVSGAVSLTLTPMLCSRFLRPAADDTPRRRLQCLRALLRRDEERLREEPRLRDEASLQRP